MRKSVLFITLLFAISMAANAQKFALIDTEYIMKNIPAAQSANEQMQEATKKYQAEGSLTERNTENVKLLRGLRRTALLVLPAALPGMNL